MSTEKNSLCNESTFSEVFNEYSESLFKFLYYKSGNEELSKDITQESFLKLWQNCAEVAFTTAKGYVFTIAKNRLFNEFEHQKVKLKFAQKPQIDKTVQSPEYLLEEKELKQEIEDAIAALPEKQRVAFLLSRIDKKTYKQIAEILGISKQAVEKRIYNALDTLRKISKKIK